MNIDEAFDKLNSILPLVERQKNLSHENRLIHRGILNSLAYSGSAPVNIEQSVLNLLAENDLIVLDNEQQEIVGAYPFSLKETSHQIFNENIDLYAMCAFDAVAIAPVFNVKTHISSHCHMSNEKIEITQDADELLETKPSDDIYIGIHWQSPGACAADNLCMEMIFLKDEHAAMQWQDKKETFSIFPLQDAIIFADKYFKPLIHD